MEASSTDTSPEELAKRISAGNSDAERELVRRYSAPLLKMLEMRCGDRQQAEDVHQEAFVVVLERLRSRGIDDPGRLSAFLRRTAVNILIGERRKLARRGTRADTELIERSRDDRYDQLAALLREEADSAVRNAVLDISNDRDREILYRFYIRQEEKTVICGVLNLSAVHFDRVISRARHRFREYIESRHGELLDAVEYGSTR